MLKFLKKTLKPELLKNHTITIILIWILFLFVLPSTIVLGVFFFMGSFAVIDLQLSEMNALILDAGLSVLFFLQHSIMVRRWFRK